jgi:hypothetical protein
MKWYSIRLVFNININNGEDRCQFDEQLRLVEAASTADAFFKGITIGRREEETFINNQGKTVNWQFIDVAEVHPLEMKNGSLICSRLHVDDNHNNYIDLIRRKSQAIQVHNTTFA